eukprot:TRINITY_DN3129_c0_g3_i1.p1 TRINITY_DN3129_c0_g3~~TRINITY_DN3129_c0_g3_i1.p1  ORF type:complete len:563 (-),score=125.85 TRINITY_DN3129_c0_g3_i1:905-2593(-)
MNGKIIDPKEVFSHHKIRIPIDFQIPGVLNTYEVAFKNDYSRNGQGLHSFEDSKDHEHYLYTQFASFFANKAFPCFDQPNLKAALRLITIAPSHWSVIGNEYEEADVELDKALDPFRVLEKHNVPQEEIAGLSRVDGGRLKIFRETPKLSTYLYAMIAGPYTVFEEHEPNFPPMRIFVRKTLQHHVKKYAFEFFRVTKKGIQYYQSVFGFPFPFNKYDQIYVPESNWGGMENVGAVTYTENVIIKEGATQQQLTSYANIMLHELAHQWFGDLVTMDWWDGLWLNESFATFISYLCMAKQEGLEKYEGAWKKFNFSKDKAYTEDQLPTTHPIAAKIMDTEEADNIFDGITYEKGASVLKQLYYFMGEETFFDGLKEYIALHQWGNTTLDDLINSFQSASTKRGRNTLWKPWFDLWLTTSGTNELTPEFVLHDHKIANFAIKQQSAPYGDQVPRYQKLVIGLYDSSFALKLFENIYVSNSETTAVPELVGAAEPEAVFLNFGDYAYAKIRLDKKSFEVFRKNLWKLEDSLTRLMVLRSVWDMVCDGLESAARFLEMLREFVRFR